MTRTLLGSDFFRRGVELHVHRCTETGPETPHHAHDFLEIAFVARGRGAHHVGESTYEIIAGDIFVINSRQPHHYANTKNLEIWYVAVGPGMLRTQLKELKRVPGFVDFFYVEPVFREETRFGQHLHLEPDAAARVAALFERMLGEYTNEDPGYDVVLRAMTMELFVTVSRLYHGFYRAHAAPEEMDSKRQAVNEVLAFIEGHYADDIRIADLAHCACLQSEYLCRVFKQATGMTMIEYLTQLRIRKASKLLAETEGSVTDICFRTGFNDLSYFTRAFRKTTGLTPTRYRKKSGSS